MLPPKSGTDYIRFRFLVTSGVGKPLVLAFGLGDLLMAALFGWALLSQRRREREQRVEQERTWLPA